MKRSEPQRTSGHRCCCQSGPKGGWAGEGEGDRERRREKDRRGWARRWEEVNKGGKKERGVGRRKRR